MGMVIAKRMGKCRKTQICLSGHVKPRALSGKMTTRPNTRLWSTWARQRWSPARRYRPERCSKNRLCGTPRPLGRPIDGFVYG